METKLCIDVESAQELAASCDSEDYTFVDIEFLGEWRWGNEYQVVFKGAEDNFWAFDYKESVGDNYWSSIDSSEANFVDCYKVERTPITTYKYTKVEQ